jgi:uncharacterized protein (TIGR00661 family)
MAGIYRLIYRKKEPVFVSIAHQYLYLEKNYHFPNDRLNVAALKLFTKITAIGSAKLFAIHIKNSFEGLSERTVLIPPLLRPAVVSSTPGNQGYFTAYILNSGYAEEIRKWHDSHPDAIIHCFWDKADAGETEIYQGNCYFHRINDTLFIEKMLGCRGLLSTAGYESVCEAMYLGKPVLMVPVENHFEQQMNALLFEEAGAGIGCTYFDIDSFIHFIQNYRPNSDFKEWVQSASEITLTNLSTLTN